MKKQLTRCLAMLLCIAMVFGLFPETVFATEIQQEIQAEEIIEDEGFKEEKPIVEETATEQEELEKIIETEADEEIIEESSNIMLLETSNETSDGETSEEGVTDVPSEETGAGESTEVPEEGSDVTEPADPTVPEEPVEPEVTRAQWLQALVVTFEMTVEEGVYPDNYFSDLSSDAEYYYDMLLAVEFGVVDIPAGGELRPDDAVTREFAAQTLNFCLGFQLGENAEYTFAEYETVTYPNDIQIAINRSWFALVEDAFLPEEAITTEEMNGMIEDAKAVLLEAEPDETVENSSVLADGVIEIPQGTEVSSTDDGDLLIVDCPVELAVGNIFIVYDDDFPVAFVATAIEEAEAGLVISVTTDGTEEAFEEFYYNGTISAKLENFVPAEATTYNINGYSVDAGITTFGIDYDSAKKTLNASKKFELTEGLKATVDFDITNMNLDMFVDKANDICSASFSGTTKATFDIHGDVVEALTTETTFVIGYVPILYGVAYMEVAAECSLSGEISLVWIGDISTGFHYSSNDFRLIKSFSKKSFSFSAEVSARVGMRTELGIDLWVLKASMWTGIGAQMDKSVTNYEEGTPKCCDDFEGYLYVDVGAKAKIFGVKEYKIEEDLLRKNNSPVRVHYHYEDKVQVSACTRSDEFSKYITAPTSNYYNASYGNVSSTYTDSNGNVQTLYTYSVTDGNATITKYHGSAYALTIPSTIDGYPVVAIGSNAFYGNTNLGTVRIPAGVTSIGSYAFSGCTGLVSAALPSTVTSIGDQAFYGCTKLVTTIPSGVTEIGMEAFYKCRSLGPTVTLDTSGVSIGQRAFYGCTNLETVTLPDSAVFDTYGAMFESCDIKLIISCDTGKIPSSFLELGYGNTEYARGRGISSVEVEEGITTIGSAAFSSDNYRTYFESPLESVVLPSTVTSIGDNAFCGCKKLTSVVLPEGVTSIGDNAFSDCTGLVSAALPSTVRTIGYQAFYNCTKLVTTIPSGVTSIGQQAFYNCTSLGPTVTLNTSGVSIGRFAFQNCTNLETVTLPDSAVFDTYGAMFESCDIKLIISCDTGKIPSSFLELDYGNTEYARGRGISSVEVEEGITTIGSAAFSSDNYSTYFESPLESVVLPSTVTSIGDNAFYGCKKLTSVVMPEGSEDFLTTIGTEAFYNCESLEEIIIPLGVKTIANRTFYNCKSLVSAQLPTTVVTIGNAAFYGCTSLTETNIANGVTSLGSSAYRNCSSLVEVSIPEFITTIDTNTFSGCSSLESVTIPENVTKINDYAFAGCTALKTAYVPNGVTYGNYVFNGDSVELHILHQVDTLPSNYLKGNKGNGISGLIISDDIISVGSSAFASMINLEEVHLSEAFTNIPVSLFDDCENLKTVNIHDRIMSIGSYAFRGCALEEAIIPDSVTDLGVYMFAGCSSLKKVKLPVTCKNVTSYMFSACSSLESIELPKMVTTIQEGAFNNCDALTDITWSPKITTIGNNAFSNCDGMVSIEFPDTIISMGSSVLAGCTALKEIMLPTPITSIPSYMFDGCTALENYQIPEQITSIGSYAFRNCDALTVVEMQEGLKTINEYAFYDCDPLPEIEIPDTVTGIGAYCFYDNDNLKSIELSKSLKSLGNYCFYDCDVLEQLTMPDSITSIGTYLCYSADALAAVELSEGLTTIPDSAFMDCQSLTEVSIPRNVTTIGTNAFSVCPALVKVTIPAKVTSINASAFSYPDRLVIYGLPGSYAETFAADKGFEFADGSLPATSVTLNKKELTLNKGATETLKLTVDPEDHTDTISWKSSNTSVVTVSEQGVVTAVGIGTATIKVNVGDVGASCKVTVVTPVSSVKLDKSSMTMNALDTYQLTATVAPADANNKTLVWFTSDASVASVDKNGLVTAWSKGTATITARATDGTNLSASCTVTVSNTAHVADTVEDMESNHNYSSNCRDIWVYTAPYAVELYVTFDERTEMEDGFDYLYIYDGSNQEVGCYTGTELAGQTINVTGDTVKLQMNSDSAGNEWGFKVSDIKVKEHTHDYVDDICKICGEKLIRQVASGYSGYTTWVLTDDHVLTFSGEGAMKNYASKSAMPWYDYLDQIESIVIEEGVTSIGEYAFYGMPNLTSIIIPESVVSIGAYAFKGSTALDGVVLPSKLTQLGESAFYGCTSLTAIDIPSTLYTVRPYTFKNCTSLEKVTLHEGNLQKLSDACFYGTVLKEVTIPDCVTIVDVYCFKNCSQLASVKISANVKQVREAVFYGTAIPTIEIPEGVTKIGPYAFKNCTNLTSISLPTTLTSVDEASFYACTALEELLLPDAVTTIGNYAFRKCEKLTSITFSDSLQTIGESSFYGCIGLTSLDIPEGVTEIKGYAFKGCTAVTEVSLPGTLVTLGESALYGCTALGTIVIPENVATVGDYAFSRCSGLYKVQFTGNAPSIGSGAFSKVKATVTYPADKTGWTADVMQNYGGTLTWKAN